MARGPSRSDYISGLRKGTGGRKLKVKSIQIRSGPLTGLIVDDIPSTARLIVAIGPNGSGKTSFLKAIEDHITGRIPTRSSAGPSTEALVTFHDTPMYSPSSIYYRSAHRTEHSVGIAAGVMIIPHLSGEYLQRRFPGTGDDKRTASNFKHLLNAAHKMTMNSSVTWTDAVAELFAPINEAMNCLFPNLTIARIDYPKGMNNADSLETLCFEKNDTKYQYSALSAGEKEVFGLLFDLTAARTEHSGALVAIDEPELHLHPSLQAAFMVQMLKLLPDDSQMFVATHSIGIASVAMDLYRTNPGEVVFLDFTNALSTAERTLKPALANREFWKHILAVALGELSDLVMPKVLVICEGRPLGTGGKTRSAEFDAKIYRAVFSDTHHDTDFVSAGSCSEVENDNLKLAASLRSTARGVQVIQVVDRDNRSPVEIQELQGKGIRVLSRYSIENYLWADEILAKCLERNCDAETTTRFLSLKRAVSNAEDHLESLKDQCSALHSELIKMPQFKGKGNNREAFALFVLAPLVTTDTSAYQQLEADIFG